MTPITRAIVGIAIIVVAACMADAAITEIGLIAVEAKMLALLLSVLAFVLVGGREGDA